MKTIKVGLVQQSNTADTKANLLKLARNIEDVCRRGAQLVILQELHNSLYFCQTEDTRMFDLAEPIPGPSTGFFGELARQFGIVLSRRSSRSAPPDCTTTRPWCSTPTAR